jgi:hypothetical protein
MSRAERSGHSGRRLLAVNTRLILALTMLTALGLLGAWWLLADAPGTPQGRALEAPELETHQQPGTRLPDAEPEDAADGLLPSVRTDTQATAMPRNVTDRTQIVGRIVDAAGVPQAGVSVSCLTVLQELIRETFQPTGHSDETDALGRFRLVGVPSAQPLALEALHTEHAPALLHPLQVASGGTYDAGDIVLQQGLRLFGTVRDTAGTPLPGARLQIFDEGRTTRSSHDQSATVVGDVFTDELGAYEVFHLGKRQYALQISLEGHASLQSLVSFMLASPTGTWEQDFTLEAGQNLLGGRFFGPDDSPVPAVSVRILRRIPNSSAYVMDTTVSDADGGFRFENLSDGSYALSIESSQWYLPLPKSLDAGFDDYVLRIQPAITILGQLQGPARLPTKFRVTAVPDASSGAAVLTGLEMTRPFSVPDSSGRFSFGGLRPGAYALDVKAPGFALTRSQDLLLAPEILEVPVTIQLRPGGTILGRISEELAGTPVELRPGTWDPALSLEFAFPTQPVHGIRTRTDGRGAFRLSHVPAGDYALTAKPPGAPELHVFNVHVEDGLDVDVGVLEVQQGGTVTGQVIDTRGQPLGAATVRLMGKSLHKQVSAELNGNFRIEAVPPGEYELVATPKAFWQAIRFAAMQMVTVTSGETVEVELLLSERQPPDRD